MPFSPTTAPTGGRVAPCEFTRIWPSGPGPLTVTDLPGPQPIAPATRRREPAQRLLMDRPYTPADGPRRGANVRRPGPPRTSPASRGGPPGPAGPRTP